MTSVMRGLSLGVAVALFAIPTAAAAHTTDVIAETGGTVTTLPMFGTSLEVEVVLDSSGNLLQVNLDPTTGVVATELGAHEVEFEFTATSTEVTVEAEGDELTIEVETASLVDLVGPGSWEADIFGTGLAEVAYEIGQVNGMPTIALVGVTVPAGVEYTVFSQNDEDEAEIRIDFFHEGFVKSLKIEVEADGDEAELNVSLHGKDVRRLVGTLTELAGTYTWEGALCDGSAVVVTYALSVDGGLSFVGVTGTDIVDVSATDESLEIVLADSEKQVEVDLDQQDGGLWELRAEVDTECDLDDDDVSAEEDESDDDVSEEEGDHQDATTNVTVVDDDDVSAEDE